MHRSAGAFIVAVLWVAWLASPARSAKVIELWKVRKDRPPETVQPSSPVTDDAQPPDEGAPAPDESPTPDPSSARLAEVLTQAAARSGLTLTGEVAALSAEALAPPPADEGAEAAAPPPVELPGVLATEAVTDYDLVALAAADFTHPKGQTIRAALVQMRSPAGAWGLFSRNRGEQPLAGLAQAASFGRGLRLWKGRHAVILAGDPPDPLADKVRLPKLGRDIAALLSGGGAPPEMVGWLPGGNQLAHSVVYFHAEAPIDSDSLGLSADSEGVAAEYQVGDTVYGALIVRYPDGEAALAGWRAFMAARLGGDAESGTPGSRRTAPEAGRWNGTRAKGRVCAFVVGAGTRNQAETLLAQALGSAHD
ncbi:MAG: hypothetical protein FJX74_04165 [Armatimonadetes bacterium]|nr:hypothetical protein [Armatimonadota bacterium]